MEWCLHKVPDASKGDLEKAISAASTAFQSWKKTSFTERAACMKKFVEGLKSRQQEFAKALTLEQGKPLGAAAGELFACIHTCKRLIKEDLLKPEVVSEDKRGRK